MHEGGPAIHNRSVCVAAKNLTRNPPRTKGYPRLAREHLLFALETRAWCQSSGGILALGVCTQTRQRAPPPPQMEFCDAFSPIPVHRCSSVRPMEPGKACACVPGVTMNVHHLSPPFSGPFCPGVVGKEKLWRHGAESPCCLS